MLYVVAIGFFLCIGTISNSAAAWNPSGSDLKAPFAYDDQISGKENASGLTPFWTPESQPSVFSKPKSVEAKRISQATWGKSGLFQERPITIAEARAAIDRAESLSTGGNLSEALLWFRFAEEALPRLADRFALKRAEILMSMNRPTEACQAFLVALDSPRRDYAALARVGQVRCAFAAGNPKSELLYTKLIQQYPKLPMAADIWFERAKAREGRGDKQGAIALYQNIDLVFPSSAAADQARAEIEKARIAGYKIRTLTPTELITRVERLASVGAIVMAREAVEPLLKLKVDDENFRYRVQRVAMRVAAIDAPSPGTPPSPSNTEQRTASIEPGINLQDVSEIERAQRLAVYRIRKIQGGKPIRNLEFSQLIAVLEIAVQYQFVEIADEVLSTMSLRTKSPVKARFDAAMMAAGVASDDRIADLLRPLINVSGYRNAARYHCARALERGGRKNEAEPLYRAILDSEIDRTRYYAIWSEQRLAEIAGERDGCCTPVTEVNERRPGPVSDSRPPEEMEPGESAVLAAVLRMIGAPALTRSGNSALAGTLENNSPHNAHETEKVTKQVTEQLSGLSQRHGAAYPWFSRAADLIALGEYTDAADELYDGYLAWRDAIGSPRLRAGLETLFTGGAPPRRSAIGPLRKAILALNRNDRALMGEIAVSLGDMGLAFRLGGWDKVGWPQPYFSKAKNAARKYGIDPGLLYAVMRVESLYDHRIVSTAGAVGLMQIMPGTGRMIADSIPVSDFDTADLFNPNTAVEFSAQHLGYLVESFKGCTPLAIAAYNAGAHNVRRWMRRAGGNAPVDAFLERIPFRETYNYVRRVLSHYAVYRAQQGLPMERFDTRMPPIPTAY